MDSNGAEQPGVQRLRSSYLCLLQFEETNIRRPLGVPETLRENSTKVNHVMLPSVHAKKTLPRHGLEVLSVALVGGILASFSYYPCWIMLVYVPGLLVSLPFSPWIQDTVHYGPVPENPFERAVFNAVGYACVAIVSKSVHSIAHRARRSHGEGACSKCGYCLTGNTSGRCPECGVAIPPASSVGSGEQTRSLEHAGRSERQE